MAGATGDRTLASTLLQLSLPAIEPAVDEREVLDAAGDADVSVLRLAHDESRGVMLWRLRR